MLAAKTKFHAGQESLALPIESLFIQSVLPASFKSQACDIPPVSICTYCVTHLTLLSHSLTHLLSGVFYKLYSQHMWCLSVVMPDTENRSCPTAA